VTREGNLGLGLNALQVGDEVYVVNSSKVPFVLRKSDRSNLDRQPEDESQIISSPMLRLIGDCYVHNIMDRVQALISTTPLLVFLREILAAFPMSPIKVRIIGRVIWAMAMAMEMGMRVLVRRIIKGWQRMDRVGR
jgi:hypothetical protein